MSSTETTAQLLTSTTTAQSRKLYQDNRHSRFLVEGAAAPPACRCGGSGPPVGAVTGNNIEARDITEPFFAHLPDLAMSVPTTNLAGRRFVASTQGPVYLLGQLATIFTTTIEKANLAPPGSSWVDNDVIDSSGVVSGNHVSGAFYSFAGSSASVGANTPQIAIADAQGHVASITASQVPPNAIMGSLIRVVLRIDGKYQADYFILGASL